MNIARQPLPPGQRERSDFPRFGLTQFAYRLPEPSVPAELQIGGLVEHAQSIADVFDGLPRVEQISDFHCVTTWSTRDLRWSGVRFSDFYRQRLLPQVKPHQDAGVVFLRGRDGARSCMLLEDMLAQDVLLVDRLNGAPLGVEHGGPLRLVAPAHYGYKSAKYLSRIDFQRDLSSFRPSGFRFMDHPRARVALEERGQWIPGWLLRSLYRPLIGPTVRRFARALQRPGADRT
jgi:DMSO/TMAO reductase YedYZ molybdopterin-dependent catalytic subunit